MPAYTFDTITADQARNLDVRDTLEIRNASARDVMVTYQSVDPLALTPEVPSILLTVGDRTVAFSTNLMALSQTGSLRLSDGSQLHIGDTSSEWISGSRLADGLWGGYGDDVLQGGDGDDRLDGGQGEDTLVGDQGNDELHGGAGRDFMLGGDGDDVIWAGIGEETGPVRLMEGSGRADGDFAHGGAGNDELHGSYGNDILFGGEGDDFIDGGDGDDLIFGDAGNDILQGGLGNDQMFGGAGDDTMDGGMGGDYLSGGEGNDVLRSSGPDGAYLEGGAGSDHLIAAAYGPDFLSGGGDGRNVFEIVALGGTDQADADQILDWTATDKLVFSAFTTMGIEPAEGEELAGLTGLAADGEFSILPMTYSEFVADSYDQALRIANEHIAHAQAQWVAAQVGNDVYVFANVDEAADGADAVVRLVGATLNDIGLPNFYLD